MKLPELEPKTDWRDALEGLAWMLVLGWLLVLGILVCLDRLLRWLG